MFNGLSFVWSWSPAGIICFLALILLYLLALRRVQRLRQQQPQTPRVSTTRIIAFFSGVVIFALVLFSPLNTIGRTQLFSVHMLQIVVLTTVCAPLMLVGSPEILLRPILSLPVVNWLITFLTKPVVASLTFNAVFFFFHLPSVLGVVSATTGLNDLMLVAIFLTSLLNWWPLIGSLHELRKMGYPLQMLYAFLDGQPVDIFAFVLVYTGVPIYHHYVMPPQLNLTPGGDQTTAGALLLIPGLVDLAVMSPLFIKWLSQIEHKTRMGDLRREQALANEDYDEYGDDEDYEDDEDESSPESYRPRISNGTQFSPS
ncbi:cytochrome c oxidase assembly protein [Ktedonobacteria bacterium brp13]|nr:cytochrome c oxidase assembly protein [Ktedonobacteria bacterium brp13]